jgi:hypothetical protein
MMRQQLRLVLCKTLFVDALRMSHTRRNMGERRKMGLAVSNDLV